MKAKRERRKELLQEMLGNDGGGNPLAKGRRRVRVSLKKVAKARGGRRKK